MVLMAGFDLPSRAIREQIASALNLVVHIERFRDGARRSRQRHRGAGHGRRRHHAPGRLPLDYKANALVPTGIRPAFTDRLLDHGISVPTTVFDLQP